MDYYIIFEGIIEQTFSQKLSQAIKNAEAANSKQIIILFSSLGGNIYEGFILASIIQNSRIPIKIHATNHIDSIGNVIFMSAKQRTSESYTKFYMHGATTEGKFDEKGLEEALLDIKTNNSRIAYFISENSGLTLKKVQSMMRVGTTISAQDALRYKIIDEITHFEIPPDAIREEILFIN